MSVNTGPGLADATMLVERAIAALAHATEQLQAALAGQLAEMRTTAANSSPELERAGEIFKGEVRALLGDGAPDDDAVRRAARQTLAEQAWEQRLGALLDTSDVMTLLGVTRQQISALTRRHRLIALKHGARPRYPAWQFAGTDAAQRACLASAHRRLVDVGALSPWSAASWFQSSHAELGDADPVAFLRAGGRCEDVLAAASRDAARAAQ